MTRPRIVRADTLDLQDQGAPSAKDHTTQNLNPAGGDVAPHQEQSLRHATEDTKSEIMHGPAVGEHLEPDGYHDGIDMHDDDDDDDMDGEWGHGQHGEEGDLTDGESDDLLDDDLMDKISSSPSIDDEDIDFEFVYALHNFVATVDGQANASKGDTMVLLDDSNSYWWLVRIVKDGSIGYLPAEHIETPTERLARLNKHRNVDLSATMLGDNNEKSKNPLKKAMRRRNAKTVNFTSPTYIEASDVDFSSDEEMDDDVSFHDEEVSREVDDVQEGQHEDIVVEPLKPKSQREKEAAESDSAHETQESDTATQRSSQELLETDSEGQVSRSRNGTVRNTDSFFKDDTAETKKISLTPNLLRDEGGNAVSAEPKESRGSLETIEQTLMKDSEKGKEDKKRKEKKSGMLSGLFKRKDKKSKSSEGDGEDQEKTSAEMARITSPPPKTSSESVSSPEAARPTEAQRQTGRLQKQPPAVMSPTKQTSRRESPTRGEAPKTEETVSSPEAPREAPKVDTTIRRVASQETDSSVQSPGSQVFHEAVTSPTSSSGSPTKSPGEQLDQGYSQRSVTSPPQRFQPTQGMEARTHKLQSPHQGSPTEAQVSPIAPGLVHDMTSPGGISSSPVSPPESPDDDRAIGDTSAGVDIGGSQPPTWSDASLRSYLDDENDIRDLFILVHDNSNVPPAGPDHPITGSLFKEESKRLKEMTSQLDNMLSDWVGRRVQRIKSK